MLRRISSFKAVNDAAKSCSSRSTCGTRATVSRRRSPTAQQRRLELTLALGSRPKILLLDEPSAGLSNEESAALAGMLRLPAYDDVAILFVAHDMDLVFGVADRILVLYYGTIVAEGTAEEIQRDEKVREIYFGSSGGVPCLRSPASIHTTARPRCCGRCPWTWRRAR